MSHNMITNGSIEQQCINEFVSEWVTTVDLKIDNGDQNILMSFDLTLEKLGYNTGDKPTDEELHKKAIDWVESKIEISAR